MCELLTPQSCNPPLFTCLAICLYSSCLSPWTAITSRTGCALIATAIIAAEAYPARSVCLSKTNSKLDRSPGGEVHSARKAIALALFAHTSTTWTGKRVSIRQTDPPIRNRFRIKIEIRDAAMRSAIYLATCLQRLAAANARAEAL